MANNEENYLISCLATAVFNSFLHNMIAMDLSHARGTTEWQEFLKVNSLKNFEKKFSAIYWKWREAKAGNETPLSPCVFNWFEGPGGQVG